MNGPSYEVSARPRAGEVRIVVTATGGTPSERIRGVGDALEAAQRAARGAVTFVYYAQDDGGSGCFGLVHCRASRSEAATAAARHAIEMRGGVAPASEVAA